MTLYHINPQYVINIDNILNIMLQLTNNISSHISSIYNIVLENQYILIVDIINQILNDYLKMYNFYSFGIRYLRVQIYNQNISLVAYINITIYPFKYCDDISIWTHFITGKYFNNPKVVYKHLDTQQKNDLRYSIISNKLYLVYDISFTHDNLLTNGILIKSKCENNCTCNTQNNNYSYITTIYWS